MRKVRIKSIFEYVFICQKSGILLPLKAIASILADKWRVGVAFICHDDYFFEYRKELSQKLSFTACKNGKFLQFIRQTVFLRLAQVGCGALCVRDRSGFAATLLLDTRKKTEDWS